VSQKVSDHKNSTKSESSQRNGDFFLGQNIMHKEVDSFLIVVPDDILSPLSQLLGSIVPG
jgi:hypothetical protein